MATASGWFAEGALTVLQQSATNQLLRTLLLAAAYERRDDFERGEVLVLDHGSLCHVTYERLVEEARRSPMRA